MTKTQLNTQLAMLTKAQSDAFNDADCGYVHYIPSSGGGTSYTTLELIDAVESLSDEDYFWLENNNSGYLIAAKRKSRPC